jgi:hypothetical protein
MRQLERLSIAGLGHRSQTGFQSSRQQVRTWSCTPWPGMGVPPRMPAWRVRSMTNCTSEDWLPVRPGGRTCAFCLHGCNASITRWHALPCRAVLNCSLGGQLPPASSRRGVRAPVQFLVCNQWHTRRAAPAVGVGRYCIELFEGGCQPAAASAFRHWTSGQQHLRFCQHARAVSPGMSRDAARSLQTGQRAARRDC